MLNYLDRRNRKPKPLVWTARADLIIGKVERLCKRCGEWLVCPLGPVILHVEPRGPCKLARAAVE